MKHVTYMHTRYALHTFVVSLHVIRQFVDASGSVATKSAVIQGLAGSGWTVIAFRDVDSSKVLLHFVEGLEDERTARALESGVFERFVQLAVSAELQCTAERLLTLTALVQYCLRVLIQTVCVLIQTVSVLAQTVGVRV